MSTLEEKINDYFEQLEKLTEKDTIEISAADLRIFLLLSRIRLEEEFPIIVINENEFAIKFTEDSPKELSIQTYIPRDDSTKDISFINMYGFSFIFALKHPQFLDTVYQMGKEVVDKMEKESH